MTMDWALVLTLLGRISPPKPLGVWELRHRARCKGIRSIDGRPIKFARKAQLLSVLEKTNG
jgi:hypothetical protein